MAKYKAPNGEVIELDEQHANLAERNGLVLIKEEKEVKEKK